MRIREELQQRKREMMQRAITPLTQEEVKILIELLELENDNRHLIRPRIKEPLKNIIEKEKHGYDTANN